MTRKISRLLGGVIILVNIGYFIPETVMAHRYFFGEFFLPLYISVHLFLIPAILTWTVKKEKQTSLLIINSIGTTWTLTWLILLIFNI